MEDGTRDNVWWGQVNHEMSPEVFDELYGKVQDYYNTLDEFYGAHDGLHHPPPSSTRGG